jgi:hypothetical protein
MTDSVIGDCCFASNSTQQTSFKPLWMITAQAAIDNEHIRVFNYLIPVIFCRPSAAPRQVPPRAVSPRPRSLRQCSEK